jgi:hypothetical protein
MATGRCGVTVIRLKEPNEAADSRSKLGPDPVSISYPALDGEMQHLLCSRFTPSRGPSFSKLFLKTIINALFQVICFIFTLHIGNLRVEVSVEVSSGSGMERPRRKPLPASSSFSSETYQLLSSPSHDQNDSLFWTQGPTRHPSSGPYEHAQRSWILVPGSSFLGIMLAGRFVPGRCAYWEC